MTPRVKICGLTTAEAMEAAKDADYLGFIFFAKSPRNLTPKQAAALAAQTERPLVAVTVNPDDALLTSIFHAFTPSYIQLHGDESPARVQQIKDTFKTPVIKAFNISTGDDIAKAQPFGNVADMLLFDAKVPKGMPGGNGLTFDWQLLANRTFAKPWFLSGGLTTDNVEEAMRITGATMIDISSSLESAPGVKDPERVRAFIKKVKSFSL